jgi:hypothetical protein
MLWDTGYERFMGFGTNLPAYRAGGHKNLWDMRGYGLRDVWVKGGPTVFIAYRQLQLLSA